MRASQASSPGTSARPRPAPGPRDWPLLGNIGLVRGLLPFLEHQWARHGDVFRVRPAGFPALVLANPEHIQHVLLTHRQSYVKGAAYDSTRRILGDGLLTLEGEAWKERRSLAQPAFHRQALAKLTAIMAESGDRYFTALEGRVASGGDVIEVHEAMVRLTLEVVINALFGRGTLESGEVSYRALGETFELLSQGVNGVQLPPWIPTARNLKFQRVLRSLDANVDQVVQAGRRYQTEGTLLTMLLAARDERGEPLSSRALRDEVVTLFLAGHETTALTLTWIFVLLADKPEIVMRMHDEVDAALAGSEPSFSDVPKLVYVRQVIDEALRLRPPAPMVVRNAVAGHALGGFAVGEGEAVLPFIWAAHRHPDYWSDPLHFVPERFASEAGKGRHPGCYLPFSVGPRICIGNAFSLIETTVLLAQLLQRFTFEVVSGADTSPVAIGTVRPAKPVRVRFTRRERGRVCDRSGRRTVS